MNDLSRVFFSGVEATSWRSSGREAVLSRVRMLPTTRSSRHPDEDKASDPFVSWLLSRSGLDARAYRSVVLHRRLPACLRQLRVNSADEARALIERHPHLRARALSALLIGVSEFFRDAAVFEFLQRHVLPSLLKRRRGLQVCSLGASHGQEIYSMAMLLAEAGVLEKSLALGIDCREDALMHAAAGSFDARELTGLDAYWKERYFTADGPRWRVRPDLRASVDWRLGDVCSLRPDEVWDIILFRNVAIYLEAAAAPSLWKGITAQLRPGGIVVTGKAEQPPPSTSLRRLGPCIYKKAD